MSDARIRLENVAQKYGYTLTALIRTPLEMKYMEYTDFEKLSDMWMPNGKKLRDCTGAEAEAMVRALEEAVRIIRGPPGTAKH